MSTDKANLAQSRGKQAPRMSEMEIDYNVMGSFPASDPPSWTLGLRPNKKLVTAFEGEEPSTSDPTHQNEPNGLKEPKDPVEIMPAD